MDTVDNMAITDVLEKAAVELEVHGWCRNMFSNAQGHRCVLGAIEKVKASEHTLMDVFIPVIERDIKYPIIFWNDEVAKDKRQVTRMLRRVAKKLRAQQ